MTTAKERPILFSGPMVRAILDGTKTQTRRVVKPQPTAGFDPYGSPMYATPAGPRIIPCPYGIPGDRLWGRETFAQGVEGCDGGISYRADHADPKGDGPAHPMKWRPSIFMPRAASRILMEITDVRVQRLQEISEDDARAEGCAPVVNDDGSVDCGTRKTTFSLLWESINGAGSWHANPWVWAITFRRLQP